MGVSILKGQNDRGEELRLDSSIEYRELAQRGADLQVKRSDADRRVQELFSQLASAREANQSAAVSSRARELAGLSGAAGATAGLGLDGAELEAEIRATRLERDALDEAIALVAAERQKLRAKLSGEICRRVEPQYRALVAKLCERVRAVAETNDEVFEFLEHLRDGDVITAALRNMAFSGAGRLSDRYSRAAAFLRECEEFGF